MREEEGREKEKEGKENGRKGEGREGVFVYLKKNADY